MRVAVVGGTAGFGYGIAIRIAAGGHEVVIGSRQGEKAEEAASRASSAAGAPIKGMTNEEAVVDADAVFVTVPFPGQVATYKAIAPNLKEGAAVIDCTVPLASEVGGKSTRMLGVWEGSAAQQAKGVVGKDVKLASGFHTMMAGALEDLSVELNGDILVCGDRDAKAAAEELVKCFSGTRYVDCGPLENARILESLTALIIGLNIRYKLESPGAGLRVESLPPPPTP